jgi:adenosylcobinamide kinase / adenosylcobinamide-phosphate guanylyltransferase
MPFTFLVGGARSGKSTLAVRIATAHEGPVTFVATGEPRDDEMAERIAVHRAERPASWTTVEAPLGLGDVVASVDGASFVVLDCLTLWVSNALEAGAADGAILDEAARAAKDLAARGTPAVVVSNEVGLGIVPMDPVSRRYRDLLGRVNATFAGVAERSFFVVAGHGLALGEVPPR